MLTARRKGLLSRTFVVEDGDGEVGRIEMGLLGATAAFELEGVRYRTEREGMLSGGFLLLAGDRELARAEKAGLLSSRFTVHFPVGAFELRKDSALGRAFGVHDEAGRVGGLRRQGFFAPRVEVDLPEEWPLPARLFVLWLALVVWNREDAAAAST